MESDKLSEVDLLKFQLVSAYMGMAKQALEALKAEEELLTLKKQTSSQRFQECKDQLKELQQMLILNYALGPKDSINFVTGEIHREASQEDQSSGSSAVAGSAKEKEEG